MWLRLNASMEGKEISNLKMSQMRNISENGQELVFNNKNKQTITI